MPSEPAGALPVTVPFVPSVILPEPTSHVAVASGAEDAADETDDTAGGEHDVVSPVPEVSSVVILSESAKSAFEDRNTIGGDDPMGDPAVLQSTDVFDTAHPADVLLDGNAVRNDRTETTRRVATDPTGHRLILELLIGGRDGEGRGDIRSLASVFGTVNVPLSLSPQLLGALELMRSELDSVEQTAERRETLVAAATTVAGTTLTVGFVTWLLRSGMLVATALTTAPLWRPLDPVPILVTGGRSRDAGERNA